MFGFFKVSPEEEEDRARLLLTRRKCLFLGAAAAGAAILKPYMPAPTSYRTYLMGADALIAPRDLPFLMKCHYDKKFLESLRSNLALTSMAKTVPIPKAIGTKFIFTPYAIGR
jgi:hypothetical protein